MVETRMNTKQRDKQEQHSFPNPFKSIPTPPCSPGTKPRQMPTSLILTSRISRLSSYQRSTTRWVHRNGFKRHFPSTFLQVPAGTLLPEQFTLKETKPHTTKGREERDGPIGV
jgi:hypothetical protein